MNESALANGSMLQNGKYRIDAFLGQGGFGITYVATHMGLNKSVAIKEFFISEYCVRKGGSNSITVTSADGRSTVEAFRTKFIKEAQNLATMQHPNIVNVSDVFEENGSVYYVMEYLDGMSIHAYIKQYGARPEAESVGYIRQIASALAYMHDRRMCHLDVKPGNVMITKDGRAVLIDFGISKRYDEAGHQTSRTPVGVSAGYAPTEQYEARLDVFTPETDIYALGATLYYCLTGKVPPEASYVLNNGLPPIEGNVSQPTKDAIISAMMPRVADRPHSMAEFLSILNNTGGRTVINPATTTIINSQRVPGTSPDMPKKKGKIIAIIAAVAVPLIILVTLAITNFVNNSNNANNNIPITSGLDVDSVAAEVVPDTIATPEDVVSEAEELVASLNNGAPESFDTDDLPITFTNAKKVSDDEINLIFVSPNDLSQLSNEDIKAYSNAMSDIMKSFRENKDCPSDISLHWFLKDSDGKVICDSY